MTQQAQRYPGPFIGPDLELAKACAVATIVDYGNDTPDEHKRIMAGGIWNDHIAVQTALTVIHTMRKAAGSPASGAAADVIERVASHNSSDPVSDDLTVPLAIQLAETEQKLRQAQALVDGARKQAFTEAMDELDKLRTLAATDFKSPNCQGQRGVDRTDAFFDAYHAIRNLSEARS